MTNTRRVIGLFVTILTAFLAAPVVGEFFVEWAKERGWYATPGARVTRALEGIQSLTDQWVFALVLGFAAGLATAYWLLPYLSVARVSTHRSGGLSSPEHGNARLLPKTLENQTAEGRTQSYADEHGVWPAAGIVSKVTALSDSSHADLRQRASDLSTRLSDYGQQMAVALRQSATPRPNETVLDAQKRLDRIRHDFVVGFQEGLLQEVRILHDELLTRLRLPFPVDGRTGLSSSGFAALASGLIKSEDGLSELGEYLISSSRKLP